MENPRSSTELLQLEEWMQKLAAAVRVGKEDDVSDPPLTGGVYVRTMIDIWLSKAGKGPKGKPTHSLRRIQRESECPNAVQKIDGPRMATRSDTRAVIHFICKNWNPIEGKDGGPAGDVPFDSKLSGHERTGNAAAPEIDDSQWNRFINRLTSFAFTDQSTSILIAYDEISSVDDIIKKFASYDFFVQGHAHSLIFNRRDVNIMPWFKAFSDTGSGILCYVMDLGNWKAPNSQDERLRFLNVFDIVGYVNHLIYSYFDVVESDGQGAEVSIGSKGIEVTAVGKPEIDDQELQKKVFFIVKNFEILKRNLWRRVTGSGGSVERNGLGADDRRAGLILAQKFGANDLLPNSSEGASRYDRLLATIDASGDGLSETFWSVKPVEDGSHVLSKASLAVMSCPAEGTAIAVKVMYHACMEKRIQTGEHSGGKFGPARVALLEHGFEVLDLLEFARLGAPRPEVN